jgi:fructosamine-3-kinase
MTGFLEDSIKRVLKNSGDECFDFSFIPFSRKIPFTAYQVSTRKQKYFIKEANPDYGEIIACEYKGLRLLQTAGCVKIPTIYHFEFYEGKKTAFLILEWIESFPHASKISQRKLGESMAVLHATSSHKFNVNRFGLDHNNYIGSTIQFNQWMDEWPVFFVKQRLLPQIHMGVEKGLIPVAFHQQLMRLCERVPEYLAADNNTPSLLHGDLWAGNVLISGNNEPILIDPAVYFGAAEAELAFTELFGGFSSEFYNAYNSILSIPYGYHDRKKLYNLYHVLNHLNLFGTIYLGQAQNICTYYAGKFNL